MSTSERKWEISDGAGHTRLLSMDEWLAEDASGCRLQAVRSFCDPDARLIDTPAIWAQCPDELLLAQDNSSQLLLEGWDARIDAAFWNARPSRHRIVDTMVSLTFAAAICAGLIGWLLS